MSSDTNASPTTPARDPSNAEWRDALEAENSHAWNPPTEEGYRFSWCTPPLVRRAAEVMDSATKPRCGGCADNLTIADVLTRMTAMPEGVTRSDSATEY